jgi:hypothetical protein
MCSSALVRAFGPPAGELIFGAGAGGRKDAAAALESAPLAGDGLTSSAKLSRPSRTGCRHTATDGADSRVTDVFAGENCDFAKGENESPCRWGAWLRQGRRLRTNASGLAPVMGSLAAISKTDVPSRLLTKDYTHDYPWLSNDKWRGVPAAEGCGSDRAIFPRQNGQTRPGLRAA